MIALSCGIEISAVHCLVLSQSTRVTDGRTDRQNYDSEDRASIAALRGKNCPKRTFVFYVRSYINNDEDEGFVYYSAPVCVCVCVCDGDGAND